MSYRSDFIISMIGMILTDISELLAFYIMFLNFPSVCGWSYHEMLFLYGFSLVALTPLQCLFDNNWNLRHYVYEGDFIKYCFRPINIFFYFISEDFDTKGLGKEHAFGAGIFLHDGESRTGDRFGDAEAAGETGGENRFARPQVAVQREHGAVRGFRRDLRGQFAGLVRRVGVIYLFHRK